MRIAFSFGKILVRRLATWAHDYSPKQKLCSVENESPFPVKVGQYIYENIRFSDSNWDSDLHKPSTDELLKKVNKKCSLTKI